MVLRGATGAWGLLILALGLLPGFCRGDDRHYVFIFGSQPTPKVVKDSHSWATFIRVIGEGTDPAGHQVFAHTISFVPTTLDVRTLALKAEPGTNLDLEGSFAYARTQNASVTAWGPFLIRPDVYQKSLEVWSMFSSGTVEYRAIDTLRDSVISDCIHAITAVDPDFGRGHYPLIRTGKSASRYIARQIVKRADPDRNLPDQTWLIAAVGLDRFPVELILPSQIPQRRGILNFRGD